MQFSACLCFKYCYPTVPQREGTPSDVMGLDGGKSFCSASRINVCCDFPTSTSHCGNKNTRAVFFLNLSFVFYQRLDQQVQQSPTTHSWLSNWGCWEEIQTETVLCRGWAELHDSKTNTDIQMFTYALFSLFAAHQHSACVSLFPAQYDGGVMLRFLSGEGAR